MCGWADTQIKYYLLGTPVIWWAGSVSLIASILVLVIYLLRRQRKYNDFDSGNYLESEDIHSHDNCLDEWEHFLYVGKIAFLGWFLHYGSSLNSISMQKLNVSPCYVVPFLIMGRVTYIHHYVSI